MPIAIHYDPEQNVLFTDVTGSVSLDEIMAYYSEVERMGLNPQYSVLADYTKADIELNYNDISLMASRRCSVSREAESMKIAVVAPIDNVFGTARMYEGVLSDERFEINVFRDRAEALQWLGIHEKQNGH